MSHIYAIKCDCCGDITVQAKSKDWHFIESIQRHFCQKPDCETAYVKECNIAALFANLNQAGEMETP